MLHIYWSSRSLQWRHKGRDGVSNHRCLHWLLNRFFFWRRSTNTSKLRVTGPLWGEFTGHRWIPSQRASNAENVFSWWRHYVYSVPLPPNGLVLQSVTSGNWTAYSVNPNTSTGYSMREVVTSWLRNSIVKNAVWTNAMTRKPITHKAQKTRISFDLDFTALGIPLIDVVKQNCFAFSIMSKL